MPTFQSIHHLDDEVAKLFGGVVKDADTHIGNGIDGSSKAVVRTHSLREREIAPLLFVPVLLRQQDVIFTAKNDANWPIIGDCNRSAKGRRDSLWPGPGADEETPFGPHKHVH